MSSVSARPVLAARSGNGRPRRIACARVRASLRRVDGARSGTYRAAKYSSMAKGSSSQWKAGWDGERLSSDPKMAGRRQLRVMQRLTPAGRAEEQRLAIAIPTARTRHAAQALDAILAHCSRHGR